MRLFLVMVITAWESRKKAKKIPPHLLPQRQNKRDILKRRKRKRRNQKKKKPAPRSGLGSEKGKSAAGPAGKQTPMERLAHFSSEGAPLFSNPRTNPETDVPCTSEAEKWTIKEMLVGRRQGLNTTRRG